MSSHQLLHITSAQANATTVVAKKGGRLHGITINNPSAQAITIYDSYLATPLSTEVIAIIPASQIAGDYLNYPNGIAFSKGLQIKIPASYTGDATLVYNEMMAG